MNDKIKELIERVKLTPQERIAVVDKALKEHYREVLQCKRVPNDYMLMMTEGGNSDAVAFATGEAQLNKILSHPDLALIVEDSTGHIVVEGNTIFCYPVIPLAEALKEVEE